MAEIETLSESAIVLLVALRDASARRYEPTAAHPDGHHTRFTLMDLVAGGLMMGGDIGAFAGPQVASMDKTGRGLCKRGLVTRQVLHTRAYYGLTDQGLALVARIEAEAGVTDLVAAVHEQEAASAAYDAAVRRRAEAYDTLRLARKECGARYPLEALLDLRRSYPMSRR